jgi:predicted transcriptional regulator
MSRNPARTSDRPLVVFRSMLDVGPATIRELSQRTDLSASVVGEMLRQLEYRGVAQVVGESRLINRRPAKVWGAKIPDGQTREDVEQAMRVSSSDEYMLAEVGKHEQVTTRELTVALHLDHQVVTSSLRRLMRAGLVEKLSPTLWRLARPEQVGELQQPADPSERSVALSPSGRRLCTRDDEADELEFGSRPPSMW